MICVEDALDALNWVDSIGGVNELIKISKKNLQIVSDWVNKSEWAQFMCKELQNRSSTSITIKIKEDWFSKISEEKQKEFMKKITTQLNDEEVARDINGYPKAPPSLRLWGGATVNNNDMKALLPWIDWIYNSEKNNV